MILEAAISLFIVVGAAFALIGSIGLARLPDIYSRVHGPTKATTLGVGGLLVASVLFFSTRGTGLSLHELLITIFLFMTAPVSAHLLVKAALHLGVPSVSVGPARDHGHGGHSGPGAPPSTGGGPNAVRGAVGSETRSGAAPASGGSRSPEPPPQHNTPSTRR
jgi:multicomponent K+:H+ antiporter subunit G